MKYSNDIEIKINSDSTNLFQVDYDFGGIRFGGSSDFIELELSNDFQYGIRNVGIYLETPRRDLELSRKTPIKDLDEVLLLGSEFGKGLEISQEYVVASAVSEYSDSSLLIDTLRYEEYDMFVGAKIEITKGNNLGQTRYVSAFDTSTRTFILEQPFNKTYSEIEEYIVRVKKTEVFSYNNGASILNPIRLLYGGGTVRPNDKAIFNLRMRLPFSLHKRLDLYNKFFSLAIQYEEAESTIV